MKEELKAYKEALYVLHEALRAYQEAFTELCVFLRDFSSQVFPYFTELEEEEIQLVEKLMEILDQYDGVKREIWTHENPFLSWTEINRFSPFWKVVMQQVFGWKPEDIEGVKTNHAKCLEAVERLGLMCLLLTDTLVDTLKGIEWEQEKAETLLKAYKDFHESECEDSLF